MIPQGTTASAVCGSQGNIESRVRVAVLAGTQTSPPGVQEGGGLGEVTSVPIGRVPRTLRHARLCFSIDRAVQQTRV